MEFSQIALQKLIQIFPELANYIVTFKDITEDSPKGEEQGLSVGVFILQFGNSYSYIPVLAKGDTVQPIDSIYDLETSSFSPLTREYITDAINSSQLSIGKAVKIPKTVIRNPSVYDMVTPPRTGKFVYASSSRLTEFLGLLPNMAKQAMLAKLSEDKEVYQALHHMFGLENLLASLRPTEPSRAAATPNQPVQVITEGVGLHEEEVKSILSKGYAVRGEPSTERIAFLANDFKDIGTFKALGSIDAGQDYDVVTKSGEILSAYIPKRSPAVPQFAALLSPYKGGDPVFALYGSGDYSISANTIARGEGRDSKEVMTHLLAANTEQGFTCSALVYGDRFALFTPALELIGVYEANTVMHSSAGVSVSARNLIESKQEGSYAYSSGANSLSSYANVTVNAVRNCTKPTFSGTNVFVPHNVLAVKLRNNIAEDLEITTTAALARVEYSSLYTLGSYSNIGYDGVEFSYNGKPVGAEPKLIEILVVKEGIAPSKAENFIKQAKEARHVKVYMSKTAYFEPGEIPQFGDAPPEQASMWDFEKGDQVVPKLKDSMSIQDPQSVEATLISELLQVMDMKDYVREYLPEIKQCVDKLGRTLFLSRLNMGELSKTHNVNELNTFVNNLRNVYKMLGENYLKLTYLVSDSEKAAR